MPTVMENKILVLEAIEYCLSIGLYDLLFNRLYLMFEKEGLNEIFI